MCVYVYIRIFACRDWCDSQKKKIPFMYVCAYTNIDIYVYKCIDICICICIYVHIYGVAGT